jgi:hypothetical protein
MGADSNVIQIVQISFIECLSAPVLWPELVVKGIPLNIRVPKDLSMFNV